MVVGFERRPPIAGPTVRNKKNEGIKKKRGAGNGGMENVPMAPIPKAVSQIENASERFVSSVISPITDLATPTFPFKIPHAVLNST